MIKLPEKIRKHLASTDYQTDSIGMSNASILLFDDMVLKIEKECEEAEHERAVMEWLSGRLPVPKVICHEKQDGMNYLLMSKASGSMLCEEPYTANFEDMVTIAAKGLEMLWQVDISDCPYQCRLDKKLEMAKYSVEHNLVDMENVEPETFGENGFKNPVDLLNWLIQNRPEEECVFSHGDFCFPNIFAENGKISGFLDMGKTGIADRYQDIALCYRSLKHNYEERREKGIPEKIKPEFLFEKLHRKPDWDKIRYYILLDELF